MATLLLLVSYLGPQALVNLVALDTHGVLGLAQSVNSASSHIYCTREATHEEPIQNNERWIRKYLWPNKNICTKQETRNVLKYKWNKYA